MNIASAKVWGITRKNMRVSFGSFEFSFKRKAPAAKTKRILVRACIAPTKRPAPLESIELMGGNQGNLLYQFSAHRALLAKRASVKTITYGEFDAGPVADRAKTINQTCDHLVLPLSSSFRLQNIDNLHKWSDLVERLDIPVTIVGIGAQINLENVENESYLPARVDGRTADQEQLIEHKKAVLRFVNAVLARSASIGVRGEITKRYLQSLGVSEDRIDVIGCPSLFMWGRDFQMPHGALTLKSSSKISLSFDHRVPATAALLENSVKSYPKARVYLQERLGAQMLMTGEDTRPKWKGDKRFPIKTSHHLYKHDRLDYFPTAWSWIRYLQTFDFACGARLHGTVAAILARTPAHILAHDSRTLEVAQHHEIPYTLTSDLENVASLSELAGRTDFTSFNNAYKDRFNRFTKFLDRNSLPCAYRAENKLGAFDASIEKAARAKGVFAKPKPPAEAVTEPAAPEQA